MNAESNEPTSDISEPSQWVHDAPPSGADQDRTFALLVVLWALGLPLFLAVLIFVGLLTVDSDHNGFWVLAAGVLILLIVTIVTLWKQRRPSRR